MEELPFKIWEKEKSRWLIPTTLFYDKQGVLTKLVASPIEEDTQIEFSGERLKKPKSFTFYLKKKPYGEAH